MLLDPFSLGIFEERKRPKRKAAGIDYKVYYDDGVVKKCCKIL